MTLTTIIYLALFTDILYQPNDGQMIATDEVGQGYCSNPPAVLFQNQLCVECSATPWNPPIQQGGKTTRAIQVPKRVPTTKSSPSRVTSKPILVEMNPENWDGDVNKLQLFVVGTKLFYKAKSGFELNGTSVIECLQGGEWSEAPSCFRTCRRLPTFPNGRCGLANFTFAQANKRVSCQCDRGYVMQGPPVLTCLPDGNFTQPPSCRLVTTPTPVVEGCDLPPILNGVCHDLKLGLYRGRALGVNEAFVCLCKPGFELRPFVRTTTIRPTTRKMLTTRRIGVRNARVAATTKRPGITTSSLQNEQNTCQPVCRGDGQYSCLPTCVRIPTTSTAAPMCPQPPDIHHSGCVECINHNRVRAIRYGDYFTYRCDPGFELVGNPKITCQRNGQWSQPPTCKLLPTTTPAPHCGPVPMITNGYCLAENDYDGVDVHFVGKEASCRCYSGFELVGSDSIFCSWRNASFLSWSEAPNCSLITTTPRPVCSLSSLQRLVPNSFCRSTGPLDTTFTLFKPGQKAVCDCLEAYVEVGYQEAICDGHDKWSSVPRCQHISTTMAPQRCTAPAVENGFCSNDDAYFNYGLNETVKCYCNKGYKLEVDVMALITCRNSANLRVEEGAWSILPVCVAVPSQNTTIPPPACPPTPALIAGGTCVKTGTRPLSSGGDVGDELTCSCGPGFTMIGPAVSYCRSKERGWSSNATCVASTTTSTTKLATTTRRLLCRGGVCRFP